MEIGSVDQASVDLSLLVSSELIFVCTPIGLIVPQIKELIPYLHKNTIITDVGSVKGPIVHSISPYGRILLVVTPWPEILVRE